MKNKFCLLLALIFIFSCGGQYSVLASDIIHRNNNTLTTITNFTISESGEALVVVQMLGYSNITAGATITIKIEKRNLLVFWSDIVEDTIVVNGSHYANELHYQLNKTGTYRCTVEYVISGTGGADDVITFEDTKTYN